MNTFTTAVLLSLFIALVSQEAAASTRDRLYRASRRWARKRNRANRRNSSSSSRSSSSAVKHPFKKPNIIFIMADDLGWNDVGFHNKLVKTPNLNWMARNGIELTDTHAQPLCSPSRASLLTGKYASNTGLQQLVVLGQSKSCLPVEHKLWPEYMKERGYATKMVGKWHLGSCDRSCLPTNRGFDEFRGILENQADYFNWTDLGVMNRLIKDQPSIEDIGTHLTIQHRRDASEMIRAHAGKKSPLFMYITPVAVHQPLQVTSDMFDRHSFLNAGDETENFRRKFLGLVAAFDDLVGETIRALKAAKLYENSIIIFTSDNGGPSGDLDFPAPFPFESFGNNYPLRGGKSSFYDGGTKSPTIFFKPNLPRRIRGTRRNFLMHISDWLPTTVQFADPSFYPSGLDGVSQRKNLGLMYRSSRKYATRSEYLAGITDYTDPALESLCSDADAALRWKDWKLIYGKVATAVVEEVAGEWVKPVENPNVPTITGDSCMRKDCNGTMVARCLFNLKVDPLEQVNLFDKRPDIVKKLLARINKFKERSVRPVFRNPIGVTPVTTTTLGSFTVPRFDYCTPSIDFPLLPRNPACSS